MSHLLHLPAKTLILSAALSMLVSCEDKAQVQENEALLEQIAESEAKVEMLENEVGKNPGDQSEKLEQTRKLLVETDSKLAELRATQGEVKADHERVKKNFQRYRAKYQVK